MLKDKQQKQQLLDENRNLRQQELRQLNQMQGQLQRDLKQAEFQIQFDPTRWLSHEIICSLLCIVPLFTQAAPMDLLWTSEKLLIAGQQSRLPHEPPWPVKQADLVAYSMTGVIPEGVKCQLELRLQQELLLSLPCSKRYILKRPLRITPWHQSGIVFTQHQSVQSRGRQ